MNPRLIEDVCGVLRPAGLSFLYRELAKRAIEESNLNGPLRLSVRELASRDFGIGCRTGHIKLYLEVLQRLQLVSIKKRHGPHKSMLYVHIPNPDWAEQFIFAMERVIRSNNYDIWLIAMQKGENSKEWESIGPVFRGMTLSIFELAPYRDSSQKVFDFAQASPNASPNASPQASPTGDAKRTRIYSTYVTSTALGKAAVEERGVDLPDPRDVIPRLKGLVQPASQMKPKPPMRKRKAKTTLYPKTFPWWEEVNKVISLIWPQNNIGFYLDGAIDSSLSNPNVEELVRMLGEGIKAKGTQAIFLSPSTIESLLHAYKTWLIVEGQTASGLAVTCIRQLATRTRDTSKKAIAPHLIEKTMAGYAYKVILSVILEKPFLAHFNPTWGSVWNGVGPIQMQKAFDQGVLSGHLPDNPRAFLVRLERFYGTVPLIRHSKQELQEVLDTKSHYEEILAAMKTSQT